VAYVLCLTGCWWGAGDSEADAGTSVSEPAALRLVIVGLIVVLLAGGLWPNAVLALAGGIR